MKRYIYTLIGFLWLAMLVPAALQASTVSVPSASYLWLMRVNGSADGAPVEYEADIPQTNYPSTNINTPASASLGAGQSLGSVSIQPSDAFVNASLFTDGSSYADGSFVEAILTYDFVVVAPSGSTNSFVPILVTGATSLFYNTYGGADQALISVSTPPRGGVPGQGGSSVQTVTLTCSGTDESGCGSQQYQISMSAPVLSGGATASGQIYLDANTGDSTYGASYSTIDPFIQIDPTFLAANPGYSIVVSDGVGNSPDVSSVPEPASIGLIGVALFGLARIQRKRNRLEEPPIAGHISS